MRNIMLLFALVTFVLPMASSAWGDERRPLIAVVVDDFGYSIEEAAKISKLAIPLTWAIIPYQKHSGDTAEMCRKKGVPFILHLPMEAIVEGNPRQSLVRVGMSDESIRLAVRNALWSLPGVVGVNNHRGSRATGNRSVMESVLREVAAEGLFFIDSRTSGGSVAYLTAVEMEVPATMNRIFLDHEAREDFMWSQFEKARAIAMKRGGAVVICHVRAETIRFLSGLYEKASGDVKFVTVPEYLEQKSISGWEE